MLLTEIFTDRVFFKKLVTLTFPITLQSLMLALVAAGDALMLGRVDQDSMAAVSLASQIQFIQNMLLGAIVSVVGILGAQYWGKRDISRLGDIFGISIRQSVVVSIAFFIGCYCFPSTLMKCFASDQNLINLGAEYLKVASWSYLLTGVSQCYLALMKVSEHASRSAWISSGAVVLNIILNAVFIFGVDALKIPALGVVGAALATVLARVIELAWCIVSSYQKTYIRLELAKVLRRNHELTLDFWKCSLPLIASFMLWGVGFTAYTAILGHLGSDAAAANSIAAVVRDLMCCLCNGIAGAGGIIIGNELGAGRLDLGKLYGQRLTVFSFAIGLFCTAVILACIPLVNATLHLSDQAQVYMTGMFAILSFYMIGRCVCTVVINGVFSAGGDTLFDMYSLIVCMWCIALPCAFIGAFVLHLPVLAIFACTCLDEVGKIPWVIHHFRKYKWVVNLTRE